MIGDQRLQNVAAAVLYATKQLVVGVFDQLGGCGIVCTAEPARTPQRRNPSMRYRSAAVVKPPPGAGSVQQSGDDEARYAVCSAASHRPFFFK